MTPREIDVLVHEKVLKQCAHILGPNEGSAESPIYHCRKCGGGGWYFRTDHEGRLVGVGHYSTNIEAAWQVMEVCPLTLIPVRLHQTLATSHLGQPIATHWLAIPNVEDIAQHPENDVDPNWVGCIDECLSRDQMAPTAPMAIALAALKAVGVSIDEKG